MPSLRIAIVGSGFAGSILARALRLLGHRVTLLDRQRHPRFALGESSTPLAAISLERLARRPGLGDLASLAAHGRWRRNLPDLRCGLKRGFTFYQHRSGGAYSNGPENDSRLLVAASPDDAVADVHWLRADVDAYLARQAEAAGVELLEGADIAEVERGALAGGSGWRLWGRHAARPGELGEPFALEADLLLDASGPGGFLARHLGLPAASTELNTALLYGHFSGVRPFSRAVAATAPGALLPPGPYPDELAAIHHLVHEGWMYALPFDHGVVSAGFVLARGPEYDALAGLRAGSDRERRPGGARSARRSLEDSASHRSRGERRAMTSGAAEGTLPSRLWEQLLRRYPTLASQFAGATPVRPVQAVPRLQHRLAQAAGPDWALLPHAFAFYSPMFSTGIAWSLLGIERLIQVVEAAARAPGSAGRSGRPEALARGLARYDRLLRIESEHLDRLVSGAYRAALWDFDLFVAWSDLYFAAASFSELRQRLCSEGGLAWAWWGFLGSTDWSMAGAVERSWEELRARQGGDRLARPPIDPAWKGSFIETIRRRIETYNVAGLADPARNRAYPVDLEPLRRQPHRLGLTSRELAERLHRLRGEPAAG